MTATRPEPLVDETILTRLRPRVTARDEPRPVSVRVPLSPAALAVLERIAEGDAAGELAVFATACGLVLAEAEGGDEFGFLVQSGRGAVPCRIDGAATAAEALDAVGAALRGPGEVSGEPDRSVLLVASRRVRRADVRNPGLLMELTGTEVRSGFDAARFERWWIEAVLRSLDGVLAQLDDRPRHALRLCSASDATFVTGLGRGGLTATEPDTLLGPVLAAARRNPTAAALIDGDVELSYQRLLAEAGRVAAELRGLGVRRGDFVATVLGKSRAAVVSLLGILRAGAAYVPLDPQLPYARLENILGDVGCPVVISDDPALPVAPDTRRVAPESLLGGSGEVVEEALATPDDVAYAIYTSGSTGTPKGVVVRHRAIASYLAWKRRYHELGPDTRLLQVPSLSFDSSVSDLFSVLGSGGCLVLLREHDRLVPARVRDAVSRHRITHITLVPSLYRVLLDAIAEPGCVRLVTVAGEASPPELIERHWRCSSRARLVNEYGPSENSIGATAFDHSDPRPGFPVGMPIDNSAVRVLDRFGRTVPPGFLGEIHVGGFGLADGYLRRPDLTAELFRELPEDPVPDGTVACDAPSRYYATGDMGWWTPEGLEFAGRRDNQVKIRGLRVELGDVEAALTGVAGAEAAVVVAVPRTDGTTGLIGFVVTSTDLEVLEARAREVLPGAMVPSLIPLPEIPLTTNGKVDRAQLTERARVDERPRSEPTGVERETEDSPDVVAAAFAEVLDVPTVGPDDSFFALGGHSLLAVELMASLDEAGFELELEDFFADPTVTGVRRSLGLSERHEEPAEDVAAVETALPEDLRRVWLADRLDNTGGPVHNLVEAFWIEGDVVEQQLRQALTEVVSRADALRLRIPVDDERPRLRIVAEPELPWRTVTAGEAELAARAEEVIGEEARRPFDLAARPPIRAAVLRGPTSALLVLSLHHIACDGDSAALLVDRFFRELRAARTGDRADRPDPPSFLDYLAWRERRSGGDERARSFWHDRLTDRPPFPLLPADGRRGAAPGSGAGVTRALPSEAAEGLTRLARQYEVTDFALLLASVNALLHRLTGLRTINIGTPVSLRHHGGFRDTIGLLLNTVVISTEVTAGDPLSRLVRRTHRGVLEAITHAEYPFARLVEDIPGSHGGGRTPLFTVMFTMDRAGAAGTGENFDAGPGTRVVRAEVNQDVSEFEMSFHADRSGDGLRLVVEYDTALFSRSRAEEILVLWESVLRCAQDSDPAVGGVEATDSGAEHLWTRPDESATDRYGPLMPDESERALLEHHAVTGATVHTESGSLIGYVTVHNGLTVDEGELRAHVRRRLPDRMTPRTVRVVDALPGNAAPPDSPPRDTTARSSAGGTGVITEAFAEVLDAPELGPHDDFFDFGGTSLLAMRVATSLRVRLGVAVSPHAVFSSRTAAALAEELASAPPVSAETTPVEEAAPTWTPLSADQEDIADALALGAPESAFAVVEPLRARHLDPAAMRSALHAVVSRHPAVHSALRSAPRRHWAPVEPRYGWSEADHRDAPDSTAVLNAALRQHIAEPFDLASGLAVRALHVRLPEEDVVVLAVHHICVDGHAMGLLVDDLLRTYRTRAPVTDPPPRPAAEFNRRQRDVLALPESRERIRARAAALCTRAAPLSLPADRPRVSRTALSSASTEIDLGAELARRLRDFCRRRGTTPFVGALAAMAVTLSGPAHASLATTLSLRGRSEWQHTVGLLSTTAVLTVDLDGSPTFDDVLARTNAALLDAQADELPFRALAEEAERGHGVDRADLARVLVVAEDPPDSSTEDEEELTPLVSTAETHARPVATTYDLAVALEPGSLRGLATYREELFDPETVASFVTDLGTTLRVALDDPHVPVVRARDPEVSS